MKEIGIGMQPGNMRRFIILSVIITCVTTVVGQQRNIANKNNWERLGPGGGGATFLPTFSFDDPGKFITRCDMTGSYFSTDSGATFTQYNFDNGAAGYAFDPHAPHTFYVGSAVLSRTTDNGKTWQQIFPLKKNIVNEGYTGDHAEYFLETNGKDGYVNESGKISHVQVDPVNNNHLYFSMGDYFFYSTNKGNTFSRIKTGGVIEYIYPGKKNTVSLFTGNAMIQYDKNTHLTRTISYPTAMQPASSFSGGTTRKNTLLYYAVHQDTATLLDGAYHRSSLWRSENGGKSWQKISDPLITNQGKAAPNFSRISCAVNDASNAYVISDLYEEQNNNETKYWFGALKTSDGGRSWNWVLKTGGGSGRYGVNDGDDAQNVNDAWGQRAFGNAFIEVEDIGVYPNDGNVAILTDWYRALRTTDGGKTWNAIYSRQKNDSAFSSNGYDVTTTYGMHFDPFDSDHLAISYTDIGYQHSFDHGKSWVRSVEGVPDGWQNTCYWVIFDPSVKNKVWSAWSGMHDIPRGKMTRNPNWKKNFEGGICISTDGGRTWKPANTGLGNDALVTSMAIDNRSLPGQRILYATVYNKGVFKSTDDGQSWTLKNNGIGKNTNAFKITDDAQGRLFLVVSPTPNYDDRQSLFYSGEVYRSTDGAEHWKKLEVTPEPFFPNNIVSDSAHPDHLFLSCWADISLSDLLGGGAAKASGGNRTIPMKGGIFYSDNGGETWRTIFDDKQYVYGVSIDPYHKKRLYCNTFNKAAWQSDDYGKSWKRISGYDFHWGHNIFPDPADHEKIYLTTYGSSVWHGTPRVEQ